MSNQDQRLPLAKAPFIGQARVRAIVIAGGVAFDTAQEQLAAPCFPDLGFGFVSPCRGDEFRAVGIETGKNLGVRRRYPPVLNDARYTGPVAR